MEGSGIGRLFFRTVWHSVLATTMLFMLSAPVTQSILIETEPWLQHLRYESEALPPTTRLGAIG